MIPSHKLQTQVTNKKIWAFILLVVQQHRHSATPHSDLGANWQRIYGAETQKNLGSNLLITASSSSDIIVEYEVCVRRANSERAKISWPPSTFMLQIRGGNR